MTGTVASRLAVVLALVCGASAAAWPIASESENLAGLRVYPDHEDPALWWYLPDRLELVESAGEPMFRFERYNYSGTAATGDRGTVWGKGILTLRVRFVPAAEAVARAKTQLSRRSRRPIGLQPVGIEKVESVLLYASAFEGGPAGDLGEGSWGNGGGADRWIERDYMLGLTPETAQMLWDTFHDDGLAMSLGYSLAGKAVSYRPQRDPFTGEVEELEAAVVTLSGDTLAIRVSPEECGPCFAETQLDAEIPAEYPFLEARCYDFSSGLAPSDLGLVIVEVRAMAVSGDRVLERVQFEPGSPATAEVHFEFAVRLDAGYEYRVVRVYEDGHTEADEWAAADGFHGILDVSERRRPEQAAQAQLDARQLY